MSMDICKDCDRLVDTDDDPDCYVEVGNMRRQTETICLCEPCRERRQQQEEEAQSQSKPDPDAQREAKRDNADWDRQCGWDKVPNEGEF